VYQEWVFLWIRIPYEVLDKTSSGIVNEVDHVNKIVYDITSKPPSTLEWESLMKITTEWGFINLEVKN